MNKEVMPPYGSLVQNINFKGDNQMNNDMEQSKVKIELTLTEFNHLFECAVFVSTSIEDEHLRLKLLDCLSKEQHTYIINKLLED